MAGFHRGRRNLPRTPGRGGAHDPDHCLYCRQPLTDPARSLITKYGDYLADKISADIGVTDQAVAASTLGVRDGGDIGCLVVPRRTCRQRGRQRTAFYPAVAETYALLTGVQRAIAGAEPSALDAESLAGGYHDRRS